MVRRKRLIIGGRKKKEAECLSLSCSLWGFLTKFMIHEDLSVQTQIQLW
jgi:hypothetical protein